MLQETKLLVGKYYRLIFNNIWKDFGKYDITVNGITSLLNSEEYSEFDIRGTFFVPIKLGISDYVTHVNDDTEIYICTIVEQKDPIKLEKKPILIPKSMIDFSSSEEFITVEKVQVSVDGITKFFNNSLEKSNYLDELIKQLKSRLKGVEYYGGIPVSVSTANQDYLMLKSNYEDFEEARQELYDKTKAAILLHSQESEAEWNYIYLKQKELLTKIEYYNTQIGLVEASLANSVIVNASTTRAALIIDRMKIIIAELLSNIPEMPSFQVLYDEAEADLIADGTIDEIPPE